MPTYEYRCTDCDEHLEVVQSFSDEPLTTCPKCGGQLRKVFSPVGIVFKGSGFYKTDSRGAGKSGSHKTKEKEKEKESSSSTPSTSPAKSDSSSSSPSSDGSSKKDSKIA